MASGAASSGGTAPSKQKSKAYLSSVAIQSDAIKYRQKYKELKRKVHEIEQVCLFIGSTYLQENDKLQALTLRIKGNIQRLRLERAYVQEFANDRILYERLEADVRNVPVASSPTGAQNQVSSSPSSSNQVNASKEQDSESTHKEVDDMGVSVDIEDTL